MREYESVWSSMMLYECTWKRMNVNEPLSWFFRVYDSIGV